LNAYSPDPPARFQAGNNPNGFSEFVDTFLLFVDIDGVGLLALARRYAPDRSQLLRAGFPASGSDVLHQLLWPGDSGNHARDSRLRRQPADGELEDAAATSLTVRI
jgi:hypothetical protein